VSEAGLGFRGFIGGEGERTPSRRGGIASAGAETAAAEEEEKRRGRRSGRIRRGACGERREEAGDIKGRGGRGGARRRSCGVMAPPTCGGSVTWKGRTRRMEEGTAAETPPTVGLFFLVCPTAWAV
jgi:hypothetical protein